jgi:hypothetical protein
MAPSTLAVRASAFTKGERSFNVKCGSTDGMEGALSKLLSNVRRLFMLKTKFEVYLVVYALALGACERGAIYLDQYPGFGGKLLALACTGSVFLAGGLMIDAIDLKERLASS